MEVKSMKEEEAKAEVDIWKYVFGFTPMAVVKCAIELQIADVIESHGGCMTLEDLSTALDCSPSALNRIMRYLTHRGFFKQQNKKSPICYTQTPLSCLLMKNTTNKNSMSPFIMLESTPTMLAPWQKLTSRLLTTVDAPPFEATHGEDLWEYASENPSHSALINDAMACHATRAVSAMVERYPEVFEGIDTLVDVGGGNGTALRNIVKACPGIKGINFDLPHVVCEAKEWDGVEHVGGDMFKCVPKADATFLMWVLHDWSDDECVTILRNCREAIPKETGKVVIAEAVLVEGEDDKYSDVRLALDMVMLAHTDKGKERTIEEWEFVVKEAGFSRFTVKHIDAIICVIEAYP